MNKRASIELVVLGLVAVIALVGLVLLFTGKATGQATGQPQTRQVLPTAEEFRIERPGAYTCECTGMCVYDQQQVSAGTAITSTQSAAMDNCKRSLENKCAPQALLNFKFSCGQDQR